MNKVHFLYCKMQLLLFLSPSCFLIAAKYKMMSGECFHFSKYTKKKNTLEWKRKSRFSGCYKRFTILCQTQPNTKKTSLIRLLLTYAGVFIHTHSQEYHVQRAYQGKGMACLQTVLARHKARETQESNNEKEIKSGIFLPPTSVLRKTFFYFRVCLCQCCLCMCVNKKRCKHDSVHVYACL